MDCCTVAGARWLLCASTYRYDGALMAAKKVASKTKAEPKAKKPTVPDGVETTYTGDRYICTYEGNTFQVDSLESVVSVVKALTT